MSSCSSLEKQKKSKNDTITEKLLQLVFKNELNSANSAKEYIHIKTEKIDSDHCLVTIVINNLESKKSSFTSNFNGIKTFNYQSKGLNNLNQELDYDAFFVPDCPSYEFLIFSKKNEILGVKKVVYYPFENSNQNDVEIKL